MKLEDEDRDSGQGAKRRSRSPHYPFVGLEKAVERVRQIYDREGKHEARFSDVAAHWDMSSTSGSAKQTIAALRQFGLVSFESGNGTNRMVKVTHLALRILLDEREAERTRALQEAARSPKLYAKMWEKWGSELPSDQNINSHLKLDLEFNPAVVDGVLNDYKATLEFAKLRGADMIPPAGEDSPADDDSPEEFMEAAKNEQESGRTAPVQTTRGVTPERLPPRNLAEKEYFRTSLAGGREVRVLFTGPVPTQKEISKLIAHLELSKDSYQVE